MGWNYRVIKKLCDVPSHAFYGQWVFGIHEVWYNSDGDICLITEDAIEPVGDSFEKVRSEMNHMMSAFGKPVLDYDKIEFGPMNEDGDNTENNVDWNMCDDSYIGSPDFDIKNFDGHVKGTKCC